MPAAQVVFYKSDDGAVPVLEFLRNLLPIHPKAYANCLARIRLLKALGHELRRPHVDYLRDGIFELRTKERTVQYRILFFYHGRNITILAHALTKEKDVPDIDIERALERKQRYEQNPSRHSAIEPIA